MGSSRIAPTWENVVEGEFTPISIFPRRGGRGCEGCTFLPFHGGPVVVYNFSGDGLPGVLINVGAAVGSQLASEIGVLDEVRQGFGETFAVLGRGQETLMAVGYDVRVTLDAGSDDGLGGGHCFQQDDAEALFADGRGAEDVGGLVVAGEHVVVDGSDEDHVFQAALGEDAVAVFVRVAGANDYEAGLGMFPLEAAVGVEEVAEALPLFQAANEEDVDFIVPKFGHGGNVGGEEVQIYAVGDDGVVVGEEALDVALGGGRYGDAAIEAAKVGFEEGVAPAVYAVAAVEGVESADVDRVGAVEDGEGEVGGEGLVEVDDVELLVAENVSDAPVEPGGEGDAGYGATAGDGHAAAQGDEVLFLAVDSVGRKGGEYSHGVAHVREPVTQLGDMGGNTTGPGEVVGGHQGYLHPVNSRRNDIEPSGLNYRR